MASAALIALVEAHAPRRPYCGDFKNYSRIRPKVTALRERYLQLNPPAHRAWLILDIDRKGAALAWEEANLPPPTYVAVNPENGHAHLGYALASPVCTFLNMWPLAVGYKHSAGCGLRLRLYGASRLSILL